MSLINTKVIVIAAIAIAILLIAQAGAQTAVQVNAPAPNGDSSPFQNIKMGGVDSSICAKIQQALGGKDPCRWSLDNTGGILKLMVGERLVASVRYAKLSWAELGQAAQNAIETKLPQFANRDFWGGYVEVDGQFQNMGVGTYVFKSGESILRSGVLRAVLDADNWLEYNKSIPSGAINVLPQLFIYVK